MADHDLDQLFHRNAGRTRPSPRFEEELLLRLEEDLDTPVPDSSPGNTVEISDADTITIRTATTRRRRSPMSSFAVVAAATIIIVGGVALVRDLRDDPATEIPAPAATPPPIDEIVSPSVLAEIDEVCRRHLPDLERYVPSADPLPGGPTDTVVEVASPVLRSMIDELRAVIEGAPPPLVGVGAELDDLDQLLGDQEILLAAGQTDQVRYGLPLIASQLRAVAADLAVAGSTACRPTPSDDGP